MAWLIVENSSHDSREHASGWRISKPTSTRCDPKRGNKLPCGEALACLDSFSETIANNLDQADWTMRREILRTLIERVVIEPQQLRIVYRINFPLFASRDSKEKVLHFC